MATDDLVTEGALSSLVSTVVADVNSVRAATSLTSVTSSATPTPVGSARINDYFLTALAAAATFAAPSGSPVNGNRLLIRIKDDGTARTIAWNAIFRAIGVTLPTTTVLGKTLYVGAVYNSAASKWDVIAVAQEA